MSSRSFAEMTCGYSMTAFEVFETVGETNTVVLLHQ